MARSLSTGGSVWLEVLLSQKSEWFRPAHTEGLNFIISEAHGLRCTDFWESQEVSWYSCDRNCVRKRQELHISIFVDIPNIINKGFLQYPKGQTPSGLLFGWEVNQKKDRLSTSFSLLSVLPLNICSIVFISNKFISVETPHKSPETIHKIPVTTHKIPRTIHKIMGTLLKIPETIQKNPRTLHRILERPHKTLATIHKV